MSSEARYQAYMLRLWAVGAGGDCKWRASLQDAHTGEQNAFVDLESVFRHLQTRMGVRPAARLEAVERGNTGTTKEMASGTETGGVAMVYFQWMIIVLLLAALLISLCEPAYRNHRTHSVSRHPRAG